LLFSYGNFSMSTPNPTPSAPIADPARRAPDASDFPDDAIDLRDLFARIAQGLPQIVGLALVGLVVAVIGAWAISRVQPVVTSTRIVFSFTGFERGEYPDHSKFQADDLRAPAVVAEALRRQSLDTSSEFQSKIRGAISVEGVIPPNIVKDRDRLRAAGQNPPVYVPDEYAVTLSLRRLFALTDQQREALLNEIIAVYRENFRRTYAQIPLAFGSAFETLKTADYPEFDIVLRADLENIRSYLARQEETAKSYRSPSTNFSFKDLSEQTDRFTQIQLNEALGLIHENGLSRNRRVALMKLDFYLRQLGERESHAVDDEKVVRDLLTETQQRAQNVVLGVKSQATQNRSDAPVLDQGLIDSLLANDATNFLLRRALDAGLKTKEIQAEKNRLLALRANLKSFIENPREEQASLTAQVDASLKNLEANYQKLIENIRRTFVDFANQRYGDAIRKADETRTEGLLLPLTIAGSVGLFLGFALGASLSLLRIYVGRQSAAK
jgi:ElaB/YqjD/DUF883 family membrane-anchored ribosome-binding protein